MNIENDNNNQPFTLGSGSGNRNDAINYKHCDYNNYQSWSNVKRGYITIGSIDENSNTLKTKYKFSRLQPLKLPTSTFTDTNLSWAPVGSEHSTVNNDFMKNKK